jgi:hypothetical protein
MPPSGQSWAKERERGQRTKRGPDSVPRRSREAVRQDHLVKVDLRRFGDNGSRHQSQVVQRDDAVGADVLEPLLRAFEGARDGIK